MSIDFYKYDIKDFLNKISDSTDKSKDSLTYISLYSTLNQVNNFYKNLKSLEDELFGDKQSLENLQMRASERGIVYKSASNAYYLMETNAEVPIGTRFSLDDYYFTTVEFMTDKTYKVMCEQTGSECNNISGKLKSIDYVEGLSSSEIIKLLIPARDDEDVESLRERYLNSFGIQPYGGNKKDYERLIEQIDGVYSGRVVRCGNGAGTVLIYILDNNLSSPTDELIETVKKELNGLKDSGQGTGLAPLGHKVYIQKVMEYELEIDITIVTNNDLDEIVKKSIKEYIEQLNKDWAKQTTGIIIRSSYIQNYIMKNDDVIDVKKVLINGEQKNLLLSKFEIPKIKSINIATEKEV